MGMRIDGRHNALREWMWEGDGGGAEGWSVI